MPGHAADDAARPGHARAQRHGRGAVPDVTRAAFLHPAAPPSAGASAAEGAQIHQLGAPAARSANAGVLGRLVEPRLSGPVHRGG